MTLKQIIDSAWTEFAVFFMELLVKYAHLPIIGTILQRLTFLSAYESNANLCAFMRLLYTDLPEPLKFDVSERYFLRFFLECQYRFTYWLIQNLGYWILPPQLRALFISYLARATHCSAFVKDCIARNTMQYVILGAGFDTMAYRTQSTRHSDSVVFEVDLPDAQSRKIKYLRKGLTHREFAYYTNNVKFVTCDFDKESVADRLLASGFKPHLSTAIILEGVTYYISEAALEQTLKDMKRLHDMGKLHLTLKTSQEPLLNAPNEKRSSTTTLSTGAGATTGSEDRSPTSSSISSLSGEAFAETMAPNTPIVDEVIKEGGDATPPLPPMSESSQFSTDHPTDLTWSDSTFSNQSPEQSSTPSVFQGPDYRIFMDVVHTRSLSEECRKGNRVWDLELRMMLKLGMPMITGYNDVQGLMSRFGFQITSQSTTWDALKRFVKAVSPTDQIHNKEFPASLHIVVDPTLKTNAQREPIMYCIDARLQS